MDCLDVWVRCLVQAQEVVMANTPGRGGDGRLKLPNSMATPERNKTIANWSAAVLGVLNSVGDIMFLTQTLHAVPVLFKVSLAAQVISAALRLLVGLGLAGRVDLSKTALYLRGLLWMVVEPLTGMRLVEEAFKTEYKRKAAHRSHMFACGRKKRTSHMVMMWNKDTNDMEESNPSAHPSVVDARNSHTKAVAEIWMAAIMGISSELLELVVQVAFVIMSGQPVLEAIFSFIFLFTVTGTLLGLGKHLYQMRALVGVLPRLEQKRDLREHVFNYELTDENLKHFAVRAGVLARSVEVHKSKEITQAGVMTLAQSCQALQNVTFRRCVKINDEAITRMAKWCHGLLKIDVTGCVEVGDKGIKAIALSCRCLTCCIVSCCDKNVTDAAVDALGQFCRNLVELNVSGCTRVTGAAIERLATRCDCLERLSVGGCKDITDGTVSHFAASCKIVQLSVGGCKDITGKALNSLGTDAASIRELDLGACSGIHGTRNKFALRQLLKSCRAINDISLEDVPELQDETVEALAIATGAHLQRIILKNGKLLTDPAIMVLAEECHYLKTVNLKGCSLLTEACVFKLLDTCQHLKVLLIEGLKDVETTKPDDTTGQTQLQRWEKQYPHIRFKRISRKKIEKKPEVLGDKLAKLKEKGQESSPEYAQVSDDLELAKAAADESKSRAADDSGGVGGAGLDSSGDGALLRADEMLDVKVGVKVLV